MADQPTPAGTATPKDVIAAACGSQRSQAERDIREAQADRILAALAAAGYTIAEAGAVTIPLDDAIGLAEFIESDPDPNHPGLIREYSALLRAAVALPRQNVRCSGKVLVGCPSQMPHHVSPKARW